MNRFASSGPITVTLIEKEGQAVYQAVLNDKLIAQINLEDWENPDVDFYSREAGQMLAEHIHEVYAASIEADIDEEAEMIKHPDGKTTDVPEGSDNKSDTAKTIIIHLNELLAKAQDAHNSKNYEMEDMLMAEAELVTEYAGKFRVEAARKFASELIQKASDLLAEGLDCTAELEAVDDLLSLVVASDIKDIEKLLEES